VLSVIGEWSEEYIISLIVNVNVKSTSGDNAVPDDGSTERTVGDDDGLI